MRIAILDDYQDTVRTLPSFAKLAGHEVRIWNDHTDDVDELAERLRDIEALALIRERTAIRAPLVERLEKLRLISNVSVYPHIDVDACARRGVLVSSFMGAGRPSYATAELTWGLVLAATRRIPQEVTALKAGRWQAHPIGTGLRGKTLGIYGYGRIGAVLAGYGKAFGMNVIAWGREGSLQRARADQLEVAETGEALFERADVLSVHVRLSDATRGMITAADLARMKPSALFVNTSRANLVVSGALEAALRAGRPGMAAIDVFEQEPVLSAQDPLLALDNVVATPHLGYVERDGLDLMLSVIFEQILAYARGGPVNVINPEARPSG